VFLKIKKGTLRCMQQKNIKALAQRRERGVCLKRRGLSSDVNIEFGKAVVRENETFYREDRSRRSNRKHFA